MVSTPAFDIDPLESTARQIAQGKVLFSHCTAYKTRQIARRVTAHFEASIASLGLKGTQFALLGFVLRDGAMKPSALAQLMDLTPSTLSRNIQPLIAQGWLTMHDGVDARSRLLSLTPDGKKLCLQAGKRWQAAQASLSGLLGAQELALLHGTLDHMLHQLKAQSVPSVD
jgi:DNA-binding MarR family transcriptional regulator